MLLATRRARLAARDHRSTKSHLATRHLLTRWPHAPVLGTGETYLQCASCRGASWIRGTSGSLPPRSIRPPLVTKA